MGLVVSRTSDHRRTAVVTEVTGQKVVMMEITVVTELHRTRCCDLSHAAGCHDGNNCCDRRISDQLF